MKLSCFTFGFFIVVDVSKCVVEEIYLTWEDELRRPKRYTTVEEVLQYYRERSKAMNETAVMITFIICITLIVISLINKR